MCGIAGQLNFDEKAPVSLEQVRRMCDTLRHRGPDERGIHVKGPVGLAMRRLSIIDLATGRQPIHNETGSIHVVFNGEIYNFPELRRSLERRGHRFYTNADTEVLVHLYEDEGEEFVHSLAGMFTVALWDQDRQKLVLARDRLGIKPLFYRIRRGVLDFGSEIKAILAAGPAGEIDLQALHDYLSLSYVPGPQTLFRDIRKLPPGHMLTCSRGTVRIRCYWEVPYPSQTGARRTRPIDELAEELRERLRHVVRQHLLSDVPLGVFLSGGLDSASLVALMRDVSSQPIRTFSIGFDDPSYDELADARHVAKVFGTDHHEMIVRPDAVELLPQLVRHFDEPFADSSAIPVYCVSRLARPHVKVCLSGEGGDEVFGGYHTYSAHALSQLYKRLPAFLTHNLIPAAVHALPVSHRRVSFDYKAKRFVDGALLPPADGHYSWKRIFSEDAKAVLYGHGPNGFEDPARFFRAAYASCPAEEPLTKLLHVDLGIYLPDDILVKADRMSMANSLEARVPFLDHRIVEFAASLPARMKVQGLRRKVLLRHAMRPLLPEQTMRGKKRGFNVPIPVWLTGELRDMVHDVLGTRRVREAGVFDPNAVGALIRQHESRQRDASRDIWTLLMFALWHEEYAPAPIHAQVAAAPVAEALHA